MFRLILKRLLLLIPVLIGVTFLVFSILSLAPGDPVLVVLGDNATEEAAEAMRSELGWISRSLSGSQLYLGSAAWRLRQVLQDKAKRL